MTKGKYWTAEELEILREIAKGYTFHKVKILLPGRTDASARSEIRYRGFDQPEREKRAWTKQDDQFLLDNRALSTRKLAELLDRPEYTVKQRRYKIGAPVHTPLAPELKPETWAYLAGFFDGDGWVGLDLRKGKQGWILVPHLAIANTDKEVIEFWCKKFAIRSRKQEPREMTDTRYSNNHRAIYQFATRGRYRVAAILKGIFPFLIVKKKAAELVLQYIETHVFSTPATKQELQAVYEFRLKHHKHGDKRRKLTTARLKKILDDWAD